MANGHIRFFTKGKRSRWSWTAGLLALIFTMPVHSQNVGDLARQQRERKTNQTKHVPHVYTNEDLAKPKILLPEDQARAQKQDNVTPAPATEAAGNEPQVVQPGQPDPLDKQQEAAVPLGDIARKYRALKAATQKNQPTSASRQELRNQTLAYPKFAPPAMKAAAPPAPAAISKAVPEVVAKVTRTDETLGGTRVKVQYGDTLWSLAKKHLGHGEDWMLVAGANPQVSDPMHLLAGTWVRLPEVPVRASVSVPSSVPASSVPSVTPSSSVPTPVAQVRTINVERGDTMWKLTQKYFGDGAAWQCIARANPKVKNADLILFGQKLTIPENCPPVSNRDAHDSEAVAVPSKSKSSPRQ